MRFKNKIKFKKIEKKIKWLKINNKPDNTNCCQGYKTTYLSLIADGNVKEYSHYERQFGS